MPVRHTWHIWNTRVNIKYYHWIRSYFRLSSRRYRYYNYPSSVRSCSEWEIKCVPVWTGKMGIFLYAHTQSGVRYSRTWWISSRIWCSQHPCLSTLLTLLALSNLKVTSRPCDDCCQPTQSTHSRNKGWGVRKDGQHKHTDCPYSFFYALSHRGV